METLSDWKLLPCKVWKGAVSTEGYGVRWYKGRSTKVHRIALENKIGKLAEGVMALHWCNNKLCHEPEHLYAGGSKENLIQALEDGLLCTKLDRVKVSLIKSILTGPRLPSTTKTKLYGPVLKAFGVSIVTIASIDAGTTWRNIT